MTKACKRLTPRQVTTAKTVYIDTDRRVPDDVADAKRKLKWKGPSLAPTDFARMTREAVKMSYNEFDPGRVATAFSKERGVCMALAREGSPAVYVTGSKAALERIAKKAKTLRADEVSMRRGVLRLWWD